MWSILKVHVPKYLSFNFAKTNKNSQTNRPHINNIDANLKITQWLLHNEWRSTNFVKPKNIALIHKNDIRFLSAHCRPLFSQFVLFNYSNYPSWLLIVQMIDAFLFWIIFFYRLIFTTLEFRGTVKATKKKVCHLHEKPQKTTHTLNVWLKSMQMN